MALKFFGMVGAALLALAPAGAIAQMSPDHGRPGHDQGRPGDNGPGRPGVGNPGHRPGPGNGPGMNRPGPNRPGPSYGNWDNRWGARPGGPPRGWGNTGDWYRHVRACQQRYRTYNPRTDIYYAHGKSARRCKL
jgi:hypothetical protein